MAATREDAPMPRYATEGPHVVGATSITVTGPEDLPLPAEVWFPAEADTGEPHAYLPGLEGRAVRGARPLDGPHPVVIFSHGHTGIRFQSISIAEQLAAWGFVVVAPDHIGNTFADTMHDMMGAIAMRRPLDVASTFDAVAAHDTFRELVDPTAGYAVMGHSFGGWTALVTAGARVDRTHLSEHCGTRRHFLCQLLELGWERWLDRSDPRVWAAVAMAPTGWATLGPEGVSHLGVPALVMGGSEDEITPWDEQQAPIVERLAGPGSLGALFAGASHYTFSDAGRLAPIDPYTRGSLPAAEAHPLVVGVTAAFLDRALGRDEGHTDALLAQVDPRITLAAARG